MTTRMELVPALQLRYSSGAFGDRIKILDEFVALTGYHRKQPSGCCGRRHPLRRGRPHGIVSMTRQYAKH